MNRRRFLHDSTLGLSAISLLGLPACATSENNDKPLFELSLAPWSLMRRPYGEADPEGIDLFDYPFEAKELGFNYIEQDNLHFPGDLPNDKDISKMKERCLEADIKSELILCGALGDAADEISEKRKAAIEKYKKWIDAAKELGCKSVRVVCADYVTIPFDEKLKIATDGVSELVEFAAAREINLLIENHNGYTSDPNWLSSLITVVNHPKCGVLADFTEWRIRRDPVELYPDPYKGIEILAPFTKSIGAKSTHFNSKGEETNVDYFRMMEIILKTGYNGFAAVEYFGEDLPRKEGIQLTKKLLENVREKLSQNTSA